MIITYVEDCDVLTAEVVEVSNSGRRIDYIELNSKGKILFTGNTRIVRNGLQSLALVYDTPWILRLIERSVNIEILANSEDPFADVFADPVALAKYLSVYPIEEPFATTSSIMNHRAELAAEAQV